MIDWTKVKTAEDKEREDKLKQADKLKARLREIDAETVRPLRAKVAGTHTQADTDKLTELEAEAETLRAKINAQ